MITLKSFMEVVDYRITEGSEYQWDSYGSNAYILDSWNGDNDNGHSFSIIFDTSSQAVYEVQIHDYKNQRAYRLIDPKFAKKHKKESKQRDVNFNQAWDEVDYVDLELDDDFLEKASAVVNDQEYDTRIQFPIDLPKDQLYNLMRLAHEQDLTLNKYVEQALEREIDNIR